MIRMATIALAIAACLASTATSVQAQDVTAAEARAIAKEAYIYGEPMVDNYRIQYAYFVDTNNPEYKAPWNEIWNSARLFSPADKAIQTPNSDTLYSMFGADLRNEPLVITVPAIEKERYFSVQLIDWYTFNFDYIGSRNRQWGWQLPARWAGLERRNGASIRSFARRPNWRSPGIARSSSTRTTSKT